MVEDAHLQYISHHAWMWNFLQGPSVPRVYKHPSQYWETEEMQKECSSI